MLFDAVLLNWTPRDPILTKRYRYLSFARNMSKNIGKNITKILSSIYSQKSLNHAKQSDADSFKTTSKIPI